MPVTLLEFCRKLAKDLLHAKHLVKYTGGDESPRKCKRVNQWLGHGKTVCSTFCAQFCSWKTTARDRYQKYTCSGQNCSQRNRTYCSCDMGYWAVWFALGRITWSTVSKQVEKRISQFRKGIPKKEKALFGSFVLLRDVMFHHQLLVTTKYIEG
jgi:hypothetical protein